MSRVYGYARISTGRQNIERQVRNITANYPKAIIVREVYTGTKFQGRKELDKILNKIQTGDILVFDSVSRMSRNSEEGCELYELLFLKGIQLIFLKEPHVNSSVYQDAISKQVNLRMNTGDAATDKFLNTILDALNEYAVDLAKQQIRIAFEQAEKEVNDLRQRTKEGIETARLNGSQIGRKEGDNFETKKSRAAKAVILKHNKTFGGSLCDEETWTQAGICRRTFYKYKRELRRETEEKHEKNEK